MVASSAIQRGHPAKMRAEMTLLEELGDDTLGQSRHIPISKMTGSDHRIEQFIRDHSVTEAQARKDGLAKRTEIDNPLASIDSLQGGERLPGIAELAVVIVFD